MGTKMCVYLFAPSRGQPSLFLFVNKQLCYARQNKNFSIKEILTNTLLIELIYIATISETNWKLMLWSIARAASCMRARCTCLGNPSPSAMSSGNPSSGARKRVRPPRSFIICISENPQVRRAGRSAMGSSICYRLVQPQVGHKSHPQPFWPAFVSQ